MNKQQYFVIWVANLIICFLLTVFAFDKGNPLYLIPVIVLFSGLLVFSLNTNLARIIHKPFSHAKGGWIL
jgi:uncharacterized membrane protein YhaH (DUF805 family)